MALSDLHDQNPVGLKGFCLTTSDAERLGCFYREAFGFEILSVSRREGTRFQAVMGVACGAMVVSLRLGSTLLELIEFDVPGLHYPENAMSDDLAFQHFAIVVSDIDRAYSHLCKMTSWRAISPAGPVRLPASSRGVSAFKFRDPDGHPLEFLEFPPESTPSYWSERSSDSVCLGFDHSAISVSDSAASIAFYKSIGFRVSGGSLNQGFEQAALDGLQPSVTVLVTSLALGVETPHLELLCYAVADLPSRIAAAANDVAATRLLFLSHEDICPDQVLDPDGHRLVFLRSEDESSAAVWFED